MKNTLEFLKRFHRDEQGPPEMGTVLIVALVVIPLVVVIVLYGKELADLFKRAWGQVTSNEGTIQK